MAKRGSRYTIYKVMTPHKAFLSANVPESIPEKIMDWPCLELVSALNPGLCPSGLGSYLGRASTFSL